MPKQLDMFDTNPYQVPVISLKVVRDGGVDAGRLVRSPADIYALVKDLIAFKDREVMLAIHMSTRNDVLAIETVCVGSLNAAHIRAADVFKGAIVNNAACIILAHNHPSMDVSPSPEDVSITRTLVEAGKLLDLPVLDHLVVGGTKFVSLNERGLGFE